MAEGLNNLQERVALVTGSTRGVGRGIAEELGAAGATVYVTGRTVEQDSATDGLPGTLSTTAKSVAALGGTPVAVRCDHTDDRQVAALFHQIRDEQGRLDVLVNNVWGGYEAYDSQEFQLPFWKQPLKKRWRGMFEAGLRAHAAAAALAAPLMIEQGRGLIINISFGDEGKYLGNLHYDVSKAAVDRMAFAMAVELQEYGVAALSLYPGFVRTERVTEGYRGDLSVTESPRYCGRAVAALAADPEILLRSGQSWKTGALAQEYGFKDVDGRQPPPFNIETPL
ncbi:MAG TPA: SDR family NAD(P)-dependent oxidoreductase [Acidobacteriota bacterium]|nr:SDR family NAD(P)-dependent oxidoreductase [Acidobacteriota bacterium]